jgi:monofunctional biosynthetic peptidoglycan transglycosylase
MALARTSRPRSRSSTRSWPRRILGWILRFIAGFLIVSILWVLLYRFVPPPITMTMIGNMFGGRSVHKDWMPLREMHPNMARAAIASEDGNFCTHHGFDFKAIRKAMESNEEGRRLYRGGSTISQQTAKNAFLWQGRSWVRKGLEAYFTGLIELLWTKHRIMEVYLNIAETGIGTYGANAGAMRYFHHDASHLTTTEAARIAAVLPLPKERSAVSPQGMVLRYGNRIARRIGGIARGGYADCVK